MSVNPEVGRPTGAPAELRPGRGWRGWLVRILFALFTYAVGVFLVVFPWTDFWAVNYLGDSWPVLRGVWLEPGFRGAITGLGFVNIYIACVQVVYSLRKS
jgi:hypothetical protein